ncbi:MAG: ACT domain-containing protein [Pseudomonas sp.]
MSGETNLARLLQPIASLREAEGLSLVLARESADRHGLSYDYVATWITLQVHSSLAAVGLTASFSAALAQAGISCNVIAGFHHDHIFVPVECAERALSTLRALSAVSLPEPD